MPRRSRAETIRRRLRGCKLAERTVDAYVALALGVFAEWKRAHGEEFPRGARVDVRERLEALAARAVDGLPDHLKFPNAWKPTSAATTRRLAYAMGLDKRVWRRAAGASAAEIKRKKYTSRATAMFDPSKERYAVFERCLTHAQMKTIRREIIDANPRPTRAKGGAWTKSRWTHVANARGEAPETSRRFQLYCGAALKRAGVDLLDICKRKGWLASGFKESGDRRGASVIYCHSPKGERKAKRQDWHTDFDAQTCPGDKHISMIVALDDGVSLPSRGARDVSKPIPVNATKATDFVPVPKGAVVFFRGDHVHAGMRGTGCALFRIHMYCADVEYKKDVVPDADRVYFVTEG